MKAKNLIFKFVVNKEEYYMESPSQAIGKKILAEKLGVDESSVSWENQNVSYKVRKKLYDKDDTQYSLFYRVKESDLGEKDKEVNFKESIKRTLLYKIGSLYQDNEDYLKTFHNKRVAYDMIRREVIAAGLQDTPLNPFTEVTLLDYLDAYQTNCTPQLKQQIHA